MKQFLLSILLLTASLLFGEDDVPLTFHLSPFTSPWAGGLNACQFGRIDLDGDGQRDLLVFDRHADRLLCFLNRGGRGEIRCQFTREYDDTFPEIHDWMIMADYDGDGREDIFTFNKGWAGITVYRNTSVGGKVAFERVVYPYLTSLQGGGEVNILATEADYPAIFDMDGDGDLDLLTFGVMGTFLEKHANRSVERYGTRDSLVFERTDLCWGRVGESEENNVMYLDTCLFGYGLTIMDDGSRHRGATVTVRDLAGDGLLDLLLADVDYPGLTLMINGGDDDQALMVSQTEQFPASYPVNLPSMPVPFFTDVNNDGVDDLLVSPFDPNPMACAGLQSLWLYLNYGTDKHPDYQLYTKSFLQETMLDFGQGAFPAVVDWDGDGLKDLVVGTISGGGLSWLRNVGTATNPAFQGVAFPIILDTLRGLVPAFYDLDADGRQEMLVGTEEGRLLLFDYDGTLLNDDFLHYDKSWSAPCFFDADQDGAVDLVVGNATGRLSYYKGKTEDGRRKTGAFEKSTDFWGGVDVRDYNVSYYGYSVPTLFQWGDEVLLAVGSESGKVFLFDGITTEEDAVFLEIGWGDLCEEMPGRLGMRSAAALDDLNGDGLPEVVVGNFGGGLQLFNADIPVVNLGTAEYHEDHEVQIFPNPVSSHLHIISKEDNIKTLVINDIYGKEIERKSMGTQEAVMLVADLPTGVYLLRLELERGWVNRIFLKR